MRKGRVATLREHTLLEGAGFRLVHSNGPRNDYWTGVNGRWTDELYLTAVPGGWQGMRRVYLHNVAQPNWRTPVFSTPRAAFAYAEIANWGQP